MEANEFNTWLQGHTARFTGLRSYLEQDAGDTKIADDWFDELRQFTIEDLKYATRQCLLADEKVWPDRQLKAIKGYAESKARDRRYVEAAPENFQNSYRCIKCRDAGTRRLLAVDRNECERLSEVTRAHLIDCVAACQCKAGKRLSEVTAESQAKGLREIVAADYEYEYEFNVQQNEDAAVDFYRALYSPNRHPEFAAFQENQ